MAKEKEMKQDRHYNVFERFFYILFIPTLFALGLTAALVGFILYINGYDVKNTVLKFANQVPYLADYVPEPEVVKTPELVREETLVKLRSQLDSRLSDLAMANSTITDKNKEIADMNNQISDLKEKLQKKMLTEEEYNSQIKAVADMYGKIPAGKVAPIIENLTLPEIVLMLKNMSEEQRVQILQKMDPQKAAESSILLKDQIPARDMQISALQARLDTLVSPDQKAEQSIGNKLTKGDMASTFTGMAPKTASDILQAMLLTNENQVISILLSMDNATRAKIMAQLPVETAASLTAKLQ